MNYGAGGSLGHLILYERKQAGSYRRDVELAIFQQSTCNYLASQFPRRTQTSRALGLSGLAVSTSEALSRPFPCLGEGKSTLLSIERISEIVFSSEHQSFSKEKRSRRVTRKAGGKPSRSPLLPSLRHSVLQRHFHTCLHEPQHQAN